LIGYNPGDMKFWFVRKFVVSREQFTQLSAVERIVEINERWNPSFIYVDRGFGQMQTELLHSYGLSHQDSGLLTKVKSIAMGGKVTVQDPFSGQIKKYTKPFIVSLSLRRFEQQEVVLPKCEYKGEGSEGLVDQINQYKVLRYSSDGRPVYSQDNEHLLTAWMLAIYGFWMEHTDLAVGPTSSKMAIISYDRTTKELKAEDYPFPTVTFELQRERIIEKKEEEKASTVSGDRSFDISCSTGSINDVGKLQNRRSQRGCRKMSFFSRKPPQRRSSF